MQRSKFNIVYISHSPFNAWKAFLVVILTGCTFPCALKQLFAQFKFFLGGTLLKTYKHTRFYSKSLMVFFYFRFCRHWWKKHTIQWTKNTKILFPQVVIFHTSIHWICSPCSKWYVFIAVLIRLENKRYELRLTLRGEILIRQQFCKYCGISFPLQYYVLFSDKDVLQLSIAMDLMNTGSHRNNYIKCSRCILYSLLLSLNGEIIFM